MPPQTSTEPTPGICSKRCEISRSSRRVSSSMLWVERAPKITTGKLSGSNLRKRGDSTSGGKSSRMRSIAARTSFAASSMLVPCANSSVTLLLPSCEDDRICSILGTLATAFSTRSVIKFSISSGPTFGYTVRMLKRGYSIGGSRSMGRKRSPMIPTTIMIKNAIVVAIGRLTDILVIFIILTVFCCFN